MNKCIKTIILVSTILISFTSIADAIVMPPGPPPQSNKQLQLQLQAQELQLEQQILQIKQQLLQLQQIDSTQKNDKPRTDLSWTDASNGQIPANPIVASYAGNKSLYVCRAKYLEGVHPGQMVDKGCMITFGGKSFVQTQYQVLTGTHRISWLPATALNRYGSPYPIMMKTNSSEPVNSSFEPPHMPIQGGYEQDKTLYICRAMYGTTIHLGKVTGDNCNIGVQTSEVMISTYEVLFD